MDTGQYCLGVFDNGWQGTLLGGIITRNVLVQVRKWAAVLRLQQHFLAVTGCLADFEYFSSCFDPRSTLLCAELTPAWRLFQGFCLIDCVCMAVMILMQYDKEKNQVGFGHTDCNAIKPAAQVRTGSLG